MMQNIGLAVRVKINLLRRLKEKWNRIIQYNKGRLNELFTLWIGTAF